MYEKLDLEAGPAEAPAAPAAPSRFNWKKALAVSVIAGGLYYVLDPINQLRDMGVRGHWHHGNRGHRGKSMHKSQCAVVEKIVPADSFANASQFFTDEYKKHSVDVWGGSVKIPSMSFDDLGEVGEDDRFDVFGDLHDYLRETFPLAFEEADVEYVNTYGLLLTFKGSDESLKPTVLMAHQDVVPVPEDTVSRWTHPPFSAHFDGEYLWGRGSGDCKNGLIGIFEAVTALLKQDFKPRRTLILSFGFDEEVSGHRGAGHLAKRIEDKYGKDSMLAILDEGGSGVQNIYGTWFGFPGTGEKGYIDVEISVQMPGGHSSTPPDHTAIGVISELISTIEATPYKPDITSRNPYYHQLQCVAEHGKDIDRKFKTAIQNIESCPLAKKTVIDKVDSERGTRYLIRTSQAVDIIHGGVKINALPELVTVQVNQRVAVEATLESVRSKILDNVNKVAKAYDMGINAFNETVFIGSNDNANGYFAVTSDSDLIPAPLTPHVDNPIWDVVGGTLRTAFEDYDITEDGPNGKSIVVAPSIMTGNTDTRYYWDLSTNVFRFSPMVAGQSFNIHTVDEHTHIAGHLVGVTFYYDFIRNFDAYEGN